MKPRKEVQANCANCMYGHYNHEDPKGGIKCDIYRMSEAFPRNPLAYEFIISITKTGDEVVELCENHQPHPDLKPNVVYA